MFTFPFTTVDNSLHFSCTSLKWFSNHPQDNDIHYAVYVQNNFAPSIIMDAKSVKSVSPGCDMDNDMMDFGLAWWVFSWKLHVHDHLDILVNVMSSVLLQDLFRNGWHSSFEFNLHRESFKDIIQALDWSSKAAYCGYFHLQCVDHAISVWHAEITICCSWSKQYKRLHETRFHRDEALHPSHSPICYIKQKSIACIQSSPFKDTYLAQCFMER